MRNLVKKRPMTLILLALMISTIIIFYNGCNNSTPTQAINNKMGIQKDNFNEEDSKKQSRSELENFLKLYANKKVIANDNEMEKIRTFVDNNCKGYFTDSFINDTTNTLSNKGFGDNDTTFYLANKGGKVSFFNNYNIYNSTVDKENETITYELESPEIGFAPTININIQMKMENGKWKINKTLH